MRIVIFGANRPTRCLLTRLSLTAGYDTGAVTRQPGTFPLRAPAAGDAARSLREVIRKIAA